MKSTVSALVAGLIFGVGLVVSEMVNPKRVQGFLDITGTWDPTLAFAMGGALVVAGIGYKLVFSRQKPLFEQTFSKPTSVGIDTRLIVGSVLFGAGWGLSGLCPGPAIVSVSTLHQGIWIFVLALVAGMKVFDLLEEKAQKHSCS